MKEEGSGEIEEIRRKEKRKKSRQTRRRERRKEDKKKTNQKEDKSQMKRKEEKESKIPVKIKRKEGKERGNQEDRNAHTQKNKILSLFFSSRLVKHRGRVRSSSFLIHWFVLQPQVSQRREFKPSSVAQVSFFMFPSFFFFYFKFRF